MYKRVLLIGKSPLVLANTSSLLQERGYTVASTDNFDKIAARFDLQQFDLIITGGQVPMDKRAEIREDAKKAKSDILLVQGLSGIPGLIVQQIEGEFAAHYRDAEHAPTYDAATREIKFFLKEPADVTVTAWWRTTFTPPNPGSDSQVLANKSFPAGEQRISIPADIPEEALFATVQIDKAIYNFSLMSPEK